MSTLQYKIAVNLLWGLPPFLENNRRRRLQRSGARAALQAKLLGRAGGLRR